VSIDADVVAGAVGESWQLLTGALPGAWVARDGGAIAWVTGVGVLYPYREPPLKTRLFLEELLGPIPQP
jgi:hypothetical protein